MPTFVPIRVRGTSICDDVVGKRRLRGQGDENAVDVDPKKFPAFIWSASGCIVEFVWLIVRAFLPDPPF